MKNETGRLLFIDNVRWTMIILVISMHAADTYSPFGRIWDLSFGPVSGAIFKSGQRGSSFVAKRFFRVCVPSPDCDRFGAGVGGSWMASFGEVHRAYGFSDGGELRGE
jgi:hypothetical protein